MAEPATVEEKLAPKAPTIKMGQSLSSQSAQLTKILENRIAADEKVEPKVEPPVEEPKQPVKEEPKEPAEEEKFIEPPAEEEPVQAKPVELPALNKYVLDKLPYLQTRIKDGEGIKVVRYKDISELPVGFESATDADRAILSADIAAQVGRAKDAIAEYKQTEQNNQLKAWEIQEAREVASDLARMQRGKILPKFKYDATDERYNEDPAVQLVNKIYKLFKETNNAYSQSGKTYRITFEDATDKYFARESRTKADDSQKSKEQPKEEPKRSQGRKEREEIAKKTGAASGGEAETAKPRVKSGMTMADIRRLANAGKI